MNAVRTIVSSGAIAASMGAALLVSSPTASAATLAPDHHPVAMQQAPTALLGICIWNCTPPTGGSGSTGGTSTPELPSAALFGIGLIPPVIVGAWWRRRHRSR